jgi:hypothetical protein
MGWDKKEKERWNVVLATREAAYEQRVENLVSTCTHTALGNERRSIPTATALKEFNPVLPEPGSKKVRGKRKSSLGREATQNRKRQKKALQAGDKPSNTGYKKRTNRM